MALREAATWSGITPETRAACLGSHDPFKGHVEYRISWTTAPEDYRQYGLRVANENMFDEVVQALVLRDIALSYLTEDPLDAAKGRAMLGDARQMLIDLAEWEIVGSHPCDLLRWPLPSKGYVGLRRTWGPTSSQCALTPPECRGGQSR